jgi:hypothetical protein
VSRYGVFTWRPLRPWLRSIIERIGAPEGWPVQPKHLRDTGTALEIDLPEYEGRFTVYVTAGPPDPEHDPKPSLDRIGNEGRFALHSSSSAETYTLHAKSRSLWLSLHAYSDSGRPVTWRPRDAPRAWFASFRVAAKTAPPPVCP